jgi:hypothetical protein
LQSKYKLGNDKSAVLGSKNMKVKLSALLSKKGSKISIENCGRSKINSKKLRVMVNSGVIISKQLKVLSSMQNLVLLLIEQWAPNLSPH